MILEGLTEEKIRDVRERLLHYTQLNRETSCWEWLGTKTGRHKYGQLKINGKTHGAARVSYELFKGPLSCNQSVRRTCGNTNCINPDHLYLTTRVINLQEVIERVIIAEAKKRKLTNRRTQND